MFLVVDMYKESGKWYATASLPISDKLLASLLTESGYTFEGIKKYIRENQKEVYNPDEFYWAVRLENQSNESPHFCQFLKPPF